jgi:adenylate kinase
MEKFYILVGPPGAGKGTQAELLSKAKKVNLIQPGNILRQEINKKSKLGREVKPYVIAGKLAPTDLINDIVYDRLKHSRKDVLFDGYPRNVTQAKVIDYLAKKDNIKVYVVEIILKDAQILERITGRRSCSCGATFHVKYNPPKVKNICDKCGKKLFIRKDSKPEIVKQRIKVYKRQTKPVIKFFRNLKGYKYIPINGNKDLKKINQEILRKIK